MPYSLSLLVLLAALSGCSLTDSRPDYTGPTDYAYTLRVSCFCIPIGPLRISVLNDTVVDVRQLEPQSSEGTVDDWINELAMTLDELDALVDCALREAADVQVTYDPTYGFPSEVSIDWIEDAVDDEISYTVTEYSPS